MIKIFKLKRFKKRRAETLMEVVIAMAVFGVMLGGICDFITNQTESVARIKKQDNILFSKQQLNAKAQWLLSKDVSTVDKNNDIVSFDWDSSEKLLVVFDDKASLSFDLN